jgi:glycosyltransferase involved in cell wall biosynthesis
MNILFYYPGFVNTDECLAGTNRMIFTVAKYLATYNNVSITSGRVSRVEKTQGVNILPYPYGRGPHDFTPFDVVVFSCGDAHLRLEKPDGQKWIRWEHCWDFPCQEWSGKIDLVVGVSELHAKHLIESGLPASKVRFIPNCINLDVFYDRQLPRDPNGVMFCGAITEGKGLHILIDAIWGLALPQSPLINLSVYGDVEMAGSSAEYLSRVKEASVGLCVQFKGAVGKDELAKAYSRNSILVLPTALESFGLVLAEAQACGCIPVVHRCGGVEAVVQDPGLMTYDDNSPRYLASRIAWGMQRHSEVDSMRKKAVEFARAEFSPQRAFDAAKRIFSEVLN